MRELKSNLNERKLRFDGVSEIEPDRLVQFLLLGIPTTKLRVSAETAEVIQMNTQVSEDEQVRIVADEPINIDLSWQLPAKYTSLDLSQHMTDVFGARLSELNYDDELTDKAVWRIVEELEEVEKRGMVEFMRTVIYILDELRRNKVVWGVGRGSSCASYLLFLIGLHVVDCVKMDVPMEEFYHE
jgi:DNA polymerase III alpha subunit